MDRVSITLGDFNDPDLLSRMPRTAREAIRSKGCVVHPHASRYDYIFACADRAGSRVRASPECVRDQQPLRRQDTIGHLYGRGTPPVWPSDHPLLLGRLALEREEQVATLGVASWNVMTQGVTRPMSRRRAAAGVRDVWTVETARAQARDVISVLDPLFAPGSGIDVVCLQEAGGGRGRPGSAGAWAEFFRPRALGAAVRARAGDDRWRSRFEVGMIDGPRGLPSQSPTTWLLARHARADAPRGQGIGTLTLVRSSALHYRLVAAPVHTRERLFGEAGHACALPLVWSDGRTVATHITNVHALPGARSFSCREVAASLGV